MDFLMSLFLGIVEGITEWLPISSTGHMILVNEFFKNNSPFFSTDLFLYVIQLGAILAICTIYFKKLNPFSLKKSEIEKRETFSMWFKVVIACLPAAVFGLLLNDYMEKFENWAVISATLIIYGVLFIIIEGRTKKTKIDSLSDLSYKTAILIGLFQVLSIIPGTSRSGSTILGGMILGCSRTLAAEFSFFLAIPVMFGVSLLKLVTNDYPMNGAAWGLLITGMVSAYIVSLAAVKFLTGYVKKHDFKVFGYYRIILGIIVILYFTFMG